MNYVPLDRLVAAASPDNRALIASLLAARAASAGAGNRRSLFARMDQVLASVSDAPTLATEPLDASLAVAGKIRITRLRLRNWKAFERADLTLPSENAGKAMVVIGGANGFGKSSILEAYALSLFGARAFSDIGFLISGAGKRGDLRRSYRAMIERSLHRSPRARGEGMCSVILDFDGSEGPFSIERKWYFDEQGGLIEDDEELLVRVGTERRPLDVPEGQSRQDWYQAEIERRVMPADLAPFFLFDGEQIDRWAERELSEQVRQALTRMLGLLDVKALAEDLLDYARDRERGNTPDEGQVLHDLDARIDQLAAMLLNAETRFTVVDDTIEGLRKARSASLEMLSQIGDRSHADLQSALEAQHRLEADRKRFVRDLTNVLADDGPMLFAGVALVARTKSQIERERAADALQLPDDEVALLWQRFLTVEPPLDPDAISGLQERFARACAGDAAPTAVDARHYHLERRTRRTVIGRLEQVAEMGARRIASIAAGLKNVEAELAQSRGAATRHTQDLEKVGELQRSLAATAAEMAGAVIERQGILDEIAGIRRELDPQRIKRDATRQVMADSEPRMRAAEQARALATGILARIDAAADAEHGRFAEAVTDSFRALSHKDQVARVEISRHGKLRLLDRNARDITDYRLSAGETQLFAMALIAAVGTLVGDRIPLVIDTPLGRLDTEHRQRVLDLLARRTAQTVLLTQPEELTPVHMERIRDALAGTIQLGHEMDDATGIGISRIADSDAVLA